MEQRRGLYERLITESIQRELEALRVQLHAHTDALHPADAADRLALHLGSLVRRAIDALGDKDRVVAGVALAGALIDRLAQGTEDSELLAERPTGSVLRAIMSRLPDGRPEAIETPMIPLLDTTLLTNAPGEPTVGSQIRAEIGSADKIDLTMAFIRVSGIRSMLDALRRHGEAGRPLRILTSTYTGTTEAQALDLLVALGGEVRVSYDTSTTRLHAKAWLFQRSSGYSTAYVGSSNLTHSAQGPGLEWNVRVSGARNPDVIAKMRAVFEAYWNGDDFVPYVADEFRELTKASTASRGTLLSPLEIRPEPFQRHLLEKIALSRQQGHHRNLLVSATGTGKTVMAALDYAGLRRTLPRARLLFVAHRKEILEQSLATFRHALRDGAFGELWVGGARPTEFEHVFASIQSLSARGGAALEHLAPTHFDVVIVDEFHHAAAPSYDALLRAVQPRELLGLTATPERSDGLPLLPWFDDRIAAELRLWDAIDQHRLCPFAYYGIHDGIDLRDVPWRRGRGYDPEALTGLLTANEAYARRVLAEIERHTDDVGRIRALGFCVSVDHARFMARVFNAAGLASVAVWADSSTEEREAALAALESGAIQVLFSVDLFNEGVDVPTINTVLFLRPTDSPTLFLQQLGRGLRRSPGKTSCAVLDFVGQHRREFRMDRRFRALLGGSRADVMRQVESGFPFLPAGCHMELDRVATHHVLENLRSAIPSQWLGRVAELREATGSTAEKRLSLASFLATTGYELEDVYWNTKSWSDMLSAAGLSTEPAGPHEPALRRACGRLGHVDDNERLDAFRAFVDRGGVLERGEEVRDLTERSRRLLRMLVASLGGRVLKKHHSLADGIALLSKHPQVLSELRELFDVLAGRVAHLHAPWDRDSAVPLQVHARYTRVEMLAACSLGKGARVAPWQTGVYWAREARADLLAFTLDKTDGRFSPTTRYRDYAISRELIHWESQSATRTESETGLRYQRHAELGSSILLFARLNTRQRDFWFLGPATYVAHAGDRPMQITWRLHHPLPADLLVEFAAAVA